ncbi:MAG: adenine phosphoribosyltransferase [Cytophagaceae bacterium]|nr:adenine phosphoribosyltransferase [Gemmatimonadaceae bacterium]
MTSSLEGRLRARIRDVPDFPRPGILFKDITPLLGDPDALREACGAMADAWRGARVTHVVAVESRGFLFGGAVAIGLGAGLVPVRKPGKLPYHCSREEYALEYGTDALEMHSDAVAAGARVVIIDDVLATGGTAAATRRLVERHGAEVVGCGFLIELGFLNGRQALGTRVESVLTY